MTGRNAAERRLRRHVGDDDRLRVRCVGRPGGVAFDRRAVLFGQPAIGLEAHHAVGIEQQDRGARDGQAVGQRVERGGIDFLDRSGPADCLGQGQTHGEVGIGSGQHRFVSRRHGVRCSAAALHRSGQLNRCVALTKVGRFRRGSRQWLARCHFPLTEP